MLRINMKKKYAILSKNEELELASNGDFVIKRALAENYEIIDFHCHTYESLFQLFPPFLRIKKSDFNKSLRVKSSIIKNNSSIWIYGIFKLAHLRKIQTPRKELFHV